MKKKGSILIVVLIILAGVEMLSLIYIGVIKSFQTSAKHSKAVDIAFYNANEGVNSVMNILLRDADWDFRTGPDGNPYNFDFDTMDFKVQVLGANTNPKTVATGNVDSSFDPTTYSIWIKCTGFYYPQNKPDLYKANPTKYGHLVKKRTIITKIGAAIPFNPFESAMFSCGSIGVNGAGNLDGHYDGKFCGKDGVDSNLASVAEVDTDCAPTANQCDDLKEAMKDWVNDICESTTHNYGPGDLTNLNNIPTTHLNGDGDLQGNYCFNDDSASYTWSGQVNGVDPSDDGDGDFSDPGETPPPIMIFKGNLGMTGHPNFKGIIIVMGKYEHENDNKVGGSDSFAGSILSFDSINVNGNSAVHFQDFSKYMNLSKNRVSRSEYYIADKPIRMDIAGTEYNVIISDLNPPN